MDVPDTLKHRIALFKSRGRTYLGEEELFSRDSWISVLRGQNIIPESYDPIAELMPEAKLKSTLNEIKAMIRKAAESSASHDEFINFNCKAKAI